MQNKKPTRSSRIVQDRSDRTYTRSLSNSGRKRSARAGRSFEEAFILANAKVFEKQASKLASRNAFRNDDSSHYNEEEIIEKSYEIAGNIDSKSDFAFDILMLDEWKMPKYIEEGLRWLAKASQNR